MVNFNFPKVWWEAKPIGGGGGISPPLAPMVATALTMINRLKVICSNQWIFKRDLKQLDSFMELISMKHY